MKTTTEKTEATRQYEMAYATHYSKHDLPSAMRLYRQVMSSFPNAPEADYSREQIRNIINSVVPKQELLDAQMALTVAHFERGT